MITPTEATKLWQLIKPLKVGMLVTTKNNDIHARPMHLLQDEFDGKLYFLTNDLAEKTQDIYENQEVCLCFSCPKSETYVSISAVANISQDKNLIQQLWTPFVSAWFKGGQDDPNLRVVMITPYAAETWNVTENTITKLFKYAKAAMSDEIPRIGEHEKMSA